jgi:hypothetical protein
MSCALHSMTDISACRLRASYVNSAINMMMGMGMPKNSKSSDRIRGSLIKMNVVC